MTSFKEEFTTEVTESTEGELISFSSSVPSSPSVVDLSPNLLPSRIQ